jgi:hypothetical protein
MLEKIIITSGTPEETWNRKSFASGSSDRSDFSFHGVGSRGPMTRTHPCKNDKLRSAGGLMQASCLHYEVSMLV